MTRELLEAYIYNLKKDIECVIDNKYHPRCHDLLNSVFLDDIPAIIKFIKKVNKAFDAKVPKSDGEYTRGYNQAIEDLRSSIYEKK